MNKKSAIESILFYYGEPISLVKLAKILDLDESSAQDLISELQTEYKTKESGLAIIQNGNMFQMATNAQNAEYLKSLISEDMREELTPAALETISIIAYRGPMTRSEIDFIRGVNSSFIIRNLLIRGLIERSVNKKDSRSYVYVLSFNFIKLLGLDKIEDLPDFENLSKPSVV